MPERDPPEPVHPSAPKPAEPSRLGGPEHPESVGGPVVFGASARTKPGERTTPAPKVPEPETLAELIRGPVPGSVRILFLDVDGTLTDGVIGHTQASDFRNFWVRDGLALQWARDLGVLSVA